MCHSLTDGNVPCNPQNDDETIELVKWMCGQGYTTGYTGNCDQIDTIDEAQQEFGQNNAMTQGQAWSFNARTLEEVGYIPPVGFTTSTQSPPGSPCQNGLVELPAHASGSDNGCRPPNCDFGRGGNGWCLPPASTDPPVVYVVGPASVNEDERTALFRVVLSHATTQPVSVTVDTQDGTATAGSDYRAANRRVTLPVGYTSRSVSVPIINDTIYEGAEGETFMLAISDQSSNAELPTDTQAEATIIDNDVEPFRGALPDVTAVCVDGEITFSWRRPVRVTGLTSYTYRIADNIHLFSSGQFYESGIIRDLDQTSVTVAVSDATLTYWAGVTTNLSNLWAETDRAGFTCTESLPEVSFAATSLAVNEGSTVQVTAMIDKTPTDTATVFFSASGGIGGLVSCSTEADYAVSGPSFTFTNTTSASITLTACDDADTTNETVTLVLTDLDINGLVLGSPTTVVVTITDTGADLPEFLS